MLIFFKLGVMVCFFNSSTTEAKPGRSLWVQRQPGLHIKLQVSQGYHHGAQSSHLSTVTMASLLGWELNEAFTMKLWEYPVQPERY